MRRRTGASQVFQLVVRFVEAQSLIQPRPRSSPNRRQDFSNRLHSLLSIFFKDNNLYKFLQSLALQWSAEAQLPKRPLHSHARPTARFSKDITYNM